MLFKNLRDEIEATRARDPAARSSLEVVFCYPGFQVLLFHRMAHWLWTHRCFFLGRFVAHVGRVLTAIDIHPGATIGKRLFIDHGIGVVIGETTEIGDDCTIYQGVTLGGTRPSRDQSGYKRHPTIGNNVIVSSNAQVLGPIKIGDGATIGAATIVLKEVPPGAIMVGNPARQLTRRKPGEAKPAFAPYGISGEDIPDPIARALSGLLDEVASLRARVNELESEKAAAQPPGPHRIADEAEGERLS
ncbi:MAG TPA: serine O-acetyltransferase [Stellaceae bacterium]|nr:serine O-acetyltransferase [Stellaceae bacterium]